MIGLEFGVYKSLGAFINSELVNKGFTDKLCYLDEDDFGRSASIYSLYQIYQNTDTKKQNSLLKYIYKITNTDNVSKKDVLALLKKTREFVSKQDLLDLINKL